MDSQTPHTPPAPEAPFFDPAQNTWVLSRYGDVLSALREPALRQAGPQKAPVQVRKDVLGSLSQSKISEWHEQIEPLAYRIIAELPADRPVDLVTGVLRPWSLALTTIVFGIGTASGKQLAALGPYLSDGNADSPAQRRSLALFNRVWRAVQRRIANARLHRILRKVRTCGAQSLFLGISQTLPDFLANAWLALLENPSQLARLRAEPHLIPRAVEELLRYSGPVHTLAREADQTVELAGVAITRGMRVMLKVARANRDPDHFSDPNSLDISRQSAGHLALGLGPHSCAGAQLLRMAAVSAIRAFADKLGTAELTDPVVWRQGSTLESPYALRVRYGQLPLQGQLHEKARPIARFGICP